MELILYALAGGVAGFIRAIITGKGLILLPKIQVVRGSRHLNLGFLTPILIGAFAGFLAPQAVGVNSFIAALAGYSGTDFIEDLIERRLKQD